MEVTEGLVSCKKNSERQITITLKNGLALRKSPSPQGEEISTIPYMQTVVFIKESDNIESPGAEESNWFKVRFNSIIFKWV